jgi:hypothetical protein
MSGNIVIAFSDHRLPLFDMEMTNQNETLHTKVRHSSDDFFEMSGTEASLSG